LSIRKRFRRRSPRPDSRHRTARVPRSRARRGPTAPRGSSRVG
jgi:hypothetical protein